MDTGFLIAEYAQTLSPELLAIRGPWPLQAESAFAWSQNARTLYGPGVNAPPANPLFWGGYIEAACILTGEHRGYDRRLGVYDRIRVKNEFAYDRCGIRNWGAWQIAYRYSYLDLNDQGINGGLLRQHTIGLNWYLTDNAKLQFQYGNIARSVPAPAVSGTIHSFGLLGQYYF